MCRSSSCAPDSGPLERPAGSRRVRDRGPDRAGNPDGGRAAGADRAACARPLRPRSGPWTAAAPLPLPRCTGFARSSPAPGARRRGLRTRCSSVLRGARVCRGVRGLGAHRMAAPVTGPLAAAPGRVHREPSCRRGTRNVRAARPLGAAPHGCRARRGRPVVPERPSAIAAATTVERVLVFPRARAPMPPCPRHPRPYGRGSPGRPFPLMLRPWPSPASPSGAPPARRGYGSGDPPGAAGATVSRPARAGRAPHPSPQPVTATRRHPGAPPPRCPATPDGKYTDPDAGVYSDPDPVGDRPERVRRVRR